MQCGFCVLPSFTGARYTVHASEENVCLIVIRHRERPGCGNTAGGSAWERRVCRRHCNPHFGAACTRALAQIPDQNRQFGPPTRACEHRDCAKAPPQQLQNRARPSANISFWSPRFPGMPVLLQHRLQFARHTVQLLSKGRETRSAMLIIFRIHVKSGSL